MSIWWKVGISAYRAKRLYLGFAAVFAESKEIAAETVKRALEGQQSGYKREWEDITIKNVEVYDEKST